MKLIKRSEEILWDTANKLRSSVYKNILEQAENFKMNR